MQRRVLVLGLAIIAIAALSAPRRPLLVWNTSPSIPTGFYQRTSAPIEPGAIVTVSARAVAPAYARTRGFDDPTDLFIKRVAATTGAMVCAEGPRVRLGAHRVLVRQRTDHGGNTLPFWTGCRALRDGEVFVLGDTPDSFDSRYFGPVPRDAIEGVWRPVRACLDCVGAPRLRVSS